MKKMTAITLSVLAFLSINSANALNAPGYRVYGGPSSAQAFPTAPNPAMTPGALCQNPNELRYPEHIKYCNRAVDTSLKIAIIANYDHQFGFHIEQMDRNLFKIDHYIPLCVGGANEITNLWPQHVSVYTITDPLEQKLCEKMAEGKLSQVNAVKLVRAGKNNLPSVPKIMQYLNSL